MPRLRVCGQFETVREGHSGTVNACGSLSSWRRPCFAGFVSRSGAWNKNSANFAFIEFSEVRALACKTAILKSLPIHPSLL